MVFPRFQGIPMPLIGVARAGARLTPGLLQRAMVEHVLNRVLGSRTDPGELDFMTGRVLCVEIGDLKWRWPVTFVGGRLACLPRQTRADVTIRGPAIAFLELMTRRADPDTVFFQRRLVIEGDTELGLAAKNFLDSVEWGDWPVPARMRTSAEESHP